MADGRQGSGVIAFGILIWLIALVLLAMPALSGFSGFLFLIGFVIILAGLAIYRGSPDGTEPDLSHPQTIDRAGRQEQEIARLIPLLKAQEKTTFDDVRRRLKLDDDEEVLDILAGLVDSGKIKGLIDKDHRQFVHMAAYRRAPTEVVQYSIASSFEFVKDGAIVIHCPYCKAPKPQTEKANEVTCKHCGQTYKIPRKILDMM
jgi:hypothetical protein